MLSTIMASRTPLTSDELAAALPSLRGWHVESNCLVRTWRFSTYEATVAFAVQVALYAQRVDHHPDLHIGYGRCEVRWTTHDAGGITARDLEAARAVTALAPI